MNWQQQFESQHNHVLVAGFIAASEEECRQYFEQRVAAKLAESDGTQELREHLIELETARRAKVLLAKSVLNRIAARDRSTVAPLPPETLKALEEALHLIELKCLDLAGSWRRDSRSDEGIEFRDYCSLAFDIRRVLPLADAIQEVLNTGNRAVVVEMPTSSGKTLLAEFRIIQAKVNVTHGWIAYLVPTRALVNQMTVRLRRDLGLLGLKVEQATPAYELDALEEELLAAPGSFDVLVTTPEKLDLLIRRGAANNNDHPLALVVLDEAHNLGDGERGLSTASGSVNSP